MTSLRIDEFVLNLNATNEIASFRIEPPIPAGSAAISTVHLSRPIEVFGEMVQISYRDESEEFQVEALSKITEGLPVFGVYDLSRSQFYYQSLVGIGVTDIRDAAIFPASNLAGPFLDYIEIQVVQEILVVYGQLKSREQVTCPPAQAPLLSLPVLDYFILTDLDNQNFRIVQKTIQAEPIENATFTKARISIVPGEDGRNTCYLIDTNPSPPPPQLPVILASNFELINLNVDSGSINLLTASLTERTFTTWNLFRGDKILMEITPNGVQIETPLDPNPLNFLSLRYTYPNT